MSFPVSQGWLSNVLSPSHGYPLGPRSGAVDSSAHWILSFSGSAVDLSGFPGPFKCYSSSELCPRCFAPMYVFCVVLLACNVSYYSQANAPLPEALIY